MSNTIVITLVGVLGLLLVLIFMKTMPVPWL